MRKIASVAILALILFLIIGGTCFADCNIVFKEDGQDWIAAYSPYIIAPSNQTYASGNLSLEVNFKGWIFGNVAFSMNYSLDGGENHTVPLTDHYYGYFPQTGGHPEKNYYDASIQLPTLSDGTHSISVYLECIWVTYQATSNTTYRGLDSQTVYFTIGNAGQNIQSHSIAPSPTTSISEFPQVAVIGLLAAASISLVYSKKRRGKR